MKRRNAHSEWYWLRPGKFPIYSEATSSKEDILFSGSDDESYDYPAQRRSRLEARGQDFLRGKPVFLLSTSLRGPFSKASGWTNPWNSANRLDGTAVQDGSVGELPEIASFPPDALTSGIEEQTSQVSSTNNVPSPSHGQPIRMSHDALPVPDPLEASSMVTNSFLDTSSVSRVEDWRDRIPSRIPSRDSFWSDNGADEAKRASSLKRSVAPGWLRKTEDGKSGKRRKLLEHDLESNPSPTRTIHSEASKRDNRIVGDSFSSAMEEDQGTLNPPTSAEVQNNHIPPTSPGGRSSKAMDINRTSVKAPAARTDVPADHSSAPNPVERETQAHIRLLSSHHAPDEAALSMPLSPASPSSPLASNTVKPLGLSPRMTRSRKRQNETGHKSLSGLRNMGRKKQETVDSRQSISAASKNPDHRTGTRSESGFESHSDDSFHYRSRASRRKAKLVDAQNKIHSTQSMPAQEPLPTRISDDLPNLVDPELPVNSPEVTPCSSTAPTQSDKEVMQRDLVVIAGETRRSTLNVSPSFAEGATLVDPELSTRAQQNMNLPPERLSPLKVLEPECDQPVPILGEDDSRREEQKPEQLLEPTVQIRNSGDLPRGVRQEVLEDPSLASVSPPNDDYDQHHTMFESIFSTAIVKSPSPQPVSNCISGSQIGAMDTETNLQRHCNIGAVSNNFDQSHLCLSDGAATGHLDDEILACDNSTPFHLQEDPDSGPLANISQRLSTQQQSPWHSSGGLDEESRPTEPNRKDFSASSDDCAHVPVETLPLVSGRNAGVIRVEEQSPWAKEATHTQRNLLENAEYTGNAPEDRISQLSIIASQALAVVRASPGSLINDDSQLSASQVRPFNPLSSPASDKDYQDMEDSALPKYSLGAEDLRKTPLRSEVVAPSTPETRLSSLPTPDFTMSIESSTKLRTPSPLRLRSASHRNSLGEGRLPSTQALLEENLSNPWLGASTRASGSRKKAKQISWGPLPGEKGHLESAPHYKDTAMGEPGFKTPAHRRAASPPPSILSNSKLPTAGQKFGKHFATLSRRRQSSTTYSRDSRFKPLLPSHSQQVCPSPAPEAMAQAFLDADARVVEDQGAVPSGTSQESKTLSGKLLDCTEQLDASPGNKSLGGGMYEGPADDDVSDVLNNLGDFLNYVDTEEELAKMGSGANKENRKPSYLDVGSMDAGIWD